MSSGLQNALASGIGVGSVYALIGLGFSAIVKATGTFNFAQGELVAWGGLLTYSLHKIAGLNAGLTLGIVILLMVLIGAAEERVAIWPLILTRGDDHDDHMAWLMTTLGVSVILTSVAQRLWGTEPLLVENYLPFRVIEIGSARIAAPYVISVAAVLAVASAMEIAQRTTLWGRALRAMGENRHAVGLSGINVRLAGIMAFAFGGAIAGLGGFVLAPITYAQTTGGLTIVLFAFASLAIGGFGSHWGALVGGMIVGLAGSLGATYLGLQYQSLSVFVVTVLVLMLRPQGIAGKGEARLV